MPDLLVQAREHDLPPKWDGHPVEWEGWQDTLAVFICPPPADRDPCAACGSIERAVTCGGIVHPLPGETFDGERLKRAKSGREYAVVVPVPAWRVVRLVAFRCPDCRHDTVWDRRTDQWWDLDHTDYGPDGSNAPEEASDA